MLNKAVFAAMSFGALALSNGAVAGDDRAALLRAEAALCQAVERSDAKTLEPGLDARFTLTDSRGGVSDRASMIAEAAKHDPAYEVFRNHDQQVRFYGQAAIITGVTTIKGSSGGKAFAGDFQFTDTWVREGGEWRIAASHASRIGQ